MRDLHVPLALVARRRLDATDFAVEVAEYVVQIGTIAVTGNASRLALEVLVFEDDAAGTALPGLQFSLQGVSQAQKEKISKEVFYLRLVKQ
jgi:hypothetical protein